MLAVLDSIGLTCKIGIIKGLAAAVFDFQRSTWRAMQYAAQPPKSTLTSIADWLKLRGVFYPFESDR